PQKGREPTEIASLEPPWVSLLRLTEDGEDQMPLTLSLQEPLIQRDLAGAADGERGTRVESFGNDVEHVLSPRGRAPPGALGKQGEGVALIEDPELSFGLPSAGGVGRIVVDASLQ